MKTLKSNLSFLCIALFSVFVLFSQAGYTMSPLVISIDVAPNVLNIESSGTVVTVHTDIAFSAVVGASVTLNGVEIDWWKSDSRGQFVAKFDMEEVEALVTAEVLELGDILLELKGVTTLGEEFTGSQTIKVIKVISEGSIKK